MSPRRLLLLFLVTVAVSGAAIWSRLDGEQGTGAGSAAGTVLFPALTAPESQLEGIEITGPGYSFSIARRGEAWVAPGYADYPIAGTRVSRLITDVAALRVWESKTRSPEMYPRIGVEDPGTPDARSHLLRFIGSDGAALEAVIVGQRSSILAARPLGGTFVRRPGDPQSWLGEGTVTIPASVSEWLGLLLHIPGPSVRSVRILEGETPVFHAAKPEGTSVYRLQPTGPVQASPATVANDAAVKSLTQGLVSMQALDVRPLADLSFTEGARSLQFETDTGLRLVVRLGQADGETWLAFTTEAPAGTDAAAQAAQINAKAEGRAFLVDAQRTAAFETPLSALFEAGN